MHRKALIISNPGESGAENYCGGVIKDVANYRSFLLSAIGGLWRESEILEMNRPSVREVRSTISDLSTYEYVVLVFAGHGWYSTDLESTVICLREGQELDSKELRLSTTKQSLILDCCRVPHVGIPEVRALMDMLAKAQPPIHPDECRRYYNEWIRKCPDELIVAYACSVGQRAADDSQKGGIYSYNLLKASRAWAHDPTQDTSKRFYILPIVAAHEKAASLVESARGTRQTPEIEKPRTGPYFPFCVVA